MKIVYLIILSFIILFGCTGGDDVNMQDGVFVPIPPNDDVTVFFEEYLPVANPFSECSFFDREDREDKCILINSVDQLKKRFPCSPDLLPAIDFSSSTLIIGHFRTSNGGGYISEQEIVVKLGKVMLNIKWGYRSGVAHSAAFTTLYYWEIYPKIKNKAISVNIVYQGYL